MHCKKACANLDHCLAISYVHCRRKVRVSASVVRVASYSGFYCELRTGAWGYWRFRKRWNQFSMCPSSLLTTLHVLTPCPLARPLATTSLVCPFARSVIATPRVGIVHNYRRCRRQQYLQTLLQHTTRHVDRFPPLQGIRWRSCRGHRSCEAQMRLRSGLPTSLIAWVWQLRNSACAWTDLCALGAPWLLLSTFCCHPYIRRQSTAWDRDGHVTR